MTRTDTAAIIVALTLAVTVAGAPQVDAATVASGTATWYRYVPGGAAAGPALRRALGSSWRGRLVTVRANGRSVRVKLSDYMPSGRLIDLDAASFAVLAPLSAGVLRVTVTAP